MVMRGRVVRLRECITIDNQRIIVLPKKITYIAILSLLLLSSGCLYVNTASHVPIKPTAVIDKIHQTLIIDGRHIIDNAVHPSGTTFDFHIRYADDLLERLSEELSGKYDKVSIVRRLPSLQEYDLLLKLSGSFDAHCNYPVNGQCKMSSVTKLTVLDKSKNAFLAETISDSFIYDFPKEGLTLGAIQVATLFLTSPILAPIARDLEGDDLTQAIVQSNGRVASQIVEALTDHPKSSSQVAKSGSAFFINDKGYALTNAHVLKQCSTIQAQVPRIGTMPAQLVASDSHNDLAIIKIDIHSSQHPALRLAPSIRQGESIVAYGFPLTGALASSGNLSTGIISATAGLEDDSRMLQISAPVQPGNSGGPLLDQNGNMIGVVTSKLNSMLALKITGDIPQNVNFAIKSSVVATFLETNGVSFNASIVKEAIPTEDVGDIATHFTFRVDCH